MEVSIERRQNIIDAIRLEKINWSGSLDHFDFLQRIYSLELFPSYDPRFQDAAGDIFQHTVNNDDWDEYWVFTDPRFSLSKAKTPDLLRFLCEMVHPVVRPDSNEASHIVQLFNEQLRQEGWHLVQAERIAGRPRYIARRTNSAEDLSISRARHVADVLDASWMQSEIERLEASVEKDPALAVGTAKDIIETCCKTILVKQGCDPGKADLPKLTKMLAKELRLLPDDIDEGAKGAAEIRKVLGNLSAITQNLAELRNLYGSGHGRDGTHRGLQPRHARLAVGCAVAFIDFVTSTYKHRTDQ